jgi:NHLM bacteriocin system ABC transporter ATP-binding protein
MSNVTERASHRILLDDASGVWRVQTGEVHVFLARTGDAGADARHHLWTAKAGELLFGCDAVEDHLFIATPTLGSVLAREALPDDSDRSTLERGFSLGLERWLEGLLGGIADLIRPHPATSEELRPSETSQLAPNSCVRGAAKITWTAGLGGHCLFLGTEWSSADAFLPLTPDSWAITLDSTQACGMTTDEVLDRRPLSQLLAETHDLLLRAAATNAHLADVDTLNRLRHRVESSSRRRSGALHQLLSSLRQLPLADADGDADPLALACAVLGRALDVRFEPATKQRRAETDIRSRVAAIARSSGMRWRVVSLPKRWWTRDLGPLLVLRVDDGAPMAALHEGGRYCIRASMTAPALVVDSDRARSISGDAIMFYRPFPANLDSLPGLARFAFHGCQRDAGRFLLTVIGLGIAASAAPLSLGLFAAWVIPSGDSGELWGLLIGLIAFAFASAGLQVIQGFSWLRIGGRSEGAASAALMDRILKLPVGFFQRYGSGDLGNRVLGLSALRTIVAGVIVGSLAPALIGFFSIIILAFIDWHFAVAGAVFGMLMLGVANLVARRQAEPQATADAMAGRNANLLIDVISGIQKLRVTATEDLFIARWARQFVTQRDAQRRADTLSDRYQALGAALPLLALAVACALGLLIPASRAGHGLLIAAQIALLQVAVASHALGNAVLAIRRTRPLQQKILPLLEAQVETRGNVVDPGVLSGALQLTEVTFSYHRDAPPVLEDFSLDISAGEFVALVGRSGCGKSTVLRLLMGFETPDRGTIQWDGQDIERLDIEAVRRQVGTVLQSGKILPGTVRQFVSGASALSDEAVWAALRMARMDEAIRKLPMGLHTGLGNNGGGLSGGQRQRLLLARALATQPRVLILDEATSALDNRTQADVMQTLRELACTRIVVAHRLSTIRHADRIVTLVDGRIAQTGTYEELVDAPGPFRDLVKRQQLD